MDASPMISGIATEAHEAAADAAGWFEVDTFLKEAFAGAHVPAYPKTEKTLQVLLRLARECKERTHQAGIVSASHARAGAEYTTESKRLMEVLDAIGIAPERLSHSGTNSLCTIAAAANELHIRDTSEAAFTIRLGEIAIQESELNASIAKSERWARELEALRLTTAQRLCDVERVLQAAQGAEKENRPALHNLRSATETFEQKRESYGLRSRHYAKQLEASGYNPEVEHEKLLARAEAIAAMEKTLHHQEQALAEFNGIPSDPAVARLSNEQAAARLRDLQQELEEHLAKD